MATSQFKKVNRTMLSSIPETKCVHKSNHSTPPKVLTLFFLLFFIYYLPVFILFFPLLFILFLLATLDLLLIHLLTTTLLLLLSQVLTNQKIHSTSTTTKTEFYNIPPPEFCERDVNISYTSLSRDPSASYLETILTNTPKPKGREFTSVHIVSAPTFSRDDYSNFVVNKLVGECKENGRDNHLYTLNFAEAQAMETPDPLWEYESIFDVTTKLILNGADRASLLIFVGPGSSIYDSFAAFIGMLPFRGISVALISQRLDYGNLSHFYTPSKVFDVKATDAPRMGMYPINSVFGFLPSKQIKVPVDTWKPMSILQTQQESKDEAVELPFKIGGLTLPMLNHNGEYYTALAALATTLERHYDNISKQFFPIVSCGETCDAMGYGYDLLELLISDKKRQGYYFTHKSGETYKCSSNYGRRTLFERISYAKENNLTPLIIAVGGGVNGNSIGLIAAITGSDFIEVPTTPMHFNDATTSAKKAFSLVQNNVILSKNIMGAFYLPLMVYCCTEMLLSISSANAHATVGEATKTMNMLGVANSKVGAQDYSNILGASEFASDFTQILTCVSGFEKLVTYINNPKTLQRKHTVCQLTKQINEVKEQLRSKSTGFQLGASEPLTHQKCAMCRIRNSESSDNLASLSSSIANSRTNSTDSLNSLVHSSRFAPTTFLSNVRSSPNLNGLRSTDVLGERGSLTALSRKVSIENMQSLVDSENDYCDSESSLLSIINAEDLARLTIKLDNMFSQRKKLMNEFRASFYKETPDEDKLAIKEFLTVINLEIVKAKAMFLAYSDPFEKYRALLFEYAHTLGHGIEAFANSLYTQARKNNVRMSSTALRLHGQCVGMAVLWAGAMSEELKVLQGHGLKLHQSFVYLFNRHGGFSFKPLRILCQQLGVTREEMCEGVLKVVRRDNKRGYCACSSATASVDQLVQERPGRMLKSSDPNAELRYLVEVPEELQARMLQRAWAGDFDRVADLETIEGTSQLVFKPFGSNLEIDSKEVGEYIHSQVAELYR